MMGGLPNEITHDKNTDSADNVDSTEATRVYDLLCLMLTDITGYAKLHPIEIELANVILAEPKRLSCNGCLQIAKKILAKCIE